MISLDNAVVARLESHGERFELLVDPDLAAELRHGNSLPIEDVVAALDIFENASQGERASEVVLLKVFGTTAFEEIALQIIRKGEIHLTAEQRKEKIAEKRRQIITFIARNAINPQTGLPHPPQRIEMALEETKINVDPFKGLEEQVKTAMKALRPIIPIRFEELRLAIKIPPDYASRAYGEIRTAATIEKDEWQSDGSWICVIRIPAGTQNDIYDLINKVSKGDAEVKILK